MGVAEGIAKVRKGWELESLDKALFYLHFHLPDDRMATKLRRLLRSCPNS